MTDHVTTTHDRRRELLRQRLAERGLAATESTDRTSVRSGVRHPLTVGQRRMWFLQTLDPTDSTLNICVSYRLEGLDDPNRLRAAIERTVSRHTILRTTFGIDADGEPYQVVHDDMTIGWQEYDLTDVDIDDRDSRTAEIAGLEFCTPFDLAAAAPMRITLIRTGFDVFVLLLVVHHVCWDDECTALFLRDVSAAYQDGATPTADATPQFVAATKHDVAPSMRDVTYWRDTLRPLPEPLELPGSAATSASRAADRRVRQLPPEVLARVEALGRSRSATPFMVLLAGFGALVRRYTGSSDFLVSIPVTDRDATADGVLGYFGNTLLLRLTSRPEDTFGGYVDSVRETCLAGFTHQSVGIDRVVREANPERAARRDGMDRLVSLGFSMRKSADEWRLDGVAAGQLDLRALTAQLPLALAVVVEADGTYVELEYHRNVLSDGLVERMLGHYVQLLDDATRHPDRLLAVVDVLGPDGRAAVLAQSHGELVATPATTVVALLEAVADGAPDAPALVSDTERMTYGELHARSNRLARWMIRQGYGPDDLVGLRMSTSTEFIVAMLAVLKAGAAYLPIDPAHPKDRIDYLVADARPRTVMGQSDVADAERQAVLLSAATVGGDERVRRLRPDHLAYVIHTSGSTGKPKGVAVTHAAIAEHVDGFAAEWDMTSQDRLLQSSSVSFDASLLDIFVTMAVGAQLVVPKPDAFGDIPYVADLISRHGVTVLHMVPSMLSTLLLLPQVTQWRQLRHVPVGGEALPGEVADKFATYFDAKLRNHYGPTEAVVCATHMPVEGAQGSAVVPIGVPNRNVYAYVLDEFLQPVPDDVVGELYLGGEQLARGYLGRPGLTAQRFVADPFSPGKRLYRSGDLVRRNPSGVLEFVGRSDEQVKVRGYRIELGEVEAAIGSHPDVAHALVLAEDGSAGAVLVAYVVARMGCATVDVDDLRVHASGVLPDYMVPSAFAVIPEIPLTVSGKLDKRALPMATPTARGGYRAPTTDVEQRVCAIFSRLFGVDRVGVDDSFFELGGHSLLAARLVAQLRAEFAVDGTVRAVFDAPTPGGLAARLADETAAPSTRPALLDAVRPDRPPLSYSQLAMWFQHRLRGPNDVFNLALSLRITGPVDRDALGAAVDDLVARHETLRTTFAEHGGVPYQNVHPSAHVTLSVRTVRDDELAAAVAELRTHVFPLETGPMIAPTLLVLGPESHALLLLVHHIVTDHVSLGVLFEDLLVAYRARVDSRVPEWEAPMQFVDHALWQWRAFGAESTWGQAELTHWRDVLAGLPTEIPMGHDHARPPVLGTRAVVTTFTLPAARRAALVGIAERSGASEFVVHQAVFAVVLHALGGGADIPIGSPVAARTDLATVDANGPFANVVVLRNDLSGDPTLRDVITRSRDTVLDALAHQELPIDRLVEALNPARSTSRNHPLFQASIHFRGDDWALGERAFAPGATVVPVSLDFEVSLLDLNVSVDARADGGLDVRVVANADLYDAATVGHVAAALQSAFDAVERTPDVALSALELLPAGVMTGLLAQPTSQRGPSAPIAPGSPETERSLIALLEELLDVDDVDRDDNFFAIGGDSIIAVQLSARATANGLALTPLMVFEYMTVAELAAAVDAGVGLAVAEPDSTSSARSDAEPVNASGLDAEALAALTASWQNQS